MPRTFPFLLVGSAFCGVSAAAAQAPMHAIPVRGAVLYEREFKRETKVLEPDPAKLNNQNVGEVPGNPGPAVVLHSDLERKGRSLEHLPTSLLDIATYAAYDLTAVGRKDWSFDTERIQPFGTLRVEGKIVPDADGVDRIVLKIGPRPGGKRDLAPENVLVAEVHIVRKFDAERGIVERINSTFTGEMFFSKRTNPDQIRRAGFTVQDNWKLREVVGNRGQVFDGRVIDAIRRGAADLKKILAGDCAKRFPAELANNGQTRQSGELALILLTLLKSGESPRDPVIAKALDDLRQRHITDTYSLGVALLVLEACYTPATERDDLLAGRLSAPLRRQPTDEDRKIIAGWVEQLLGNRNEGARDGATKWHYLPSPDFDNSCSQYAVLGLYAADLCGVEVDRDVWIGAARHFLQVQCGSTGNVRFDLTTHQQVAKDRAGRGTVAATDAAGWSYKDKDNQATGSMTTAGLCSLTLCDVVLSGKARPADVSGSELRGAIKSGFAWLASHYDVRNNPGAGEGWYLYYLYGLERACELNQIAWIQSRDWYFDGATMLLELQAPNGRWGEEVDTCFAILFLKKAALPAITGPR